MGKCQLHDQHAAQPALTYFSGRATQGQREHSSRGDAQHKWKENLNEPSAHCKQTHIYSKRRETDFKSKAHAMPPVPGIVLHVLLA